MVSPPRKVSETKESDSVLDDASTAGRDSKLERQKGVVRQSIREIPSQGQLSCSEGTEKDDTDIWTAAASESLPENSSPSQTRIQRLKDQWTWEILSVAVSTSCIIAMAVVLAHINGKALALWALPLQPNALISIFAAIAKSALILPLTECISQYKWLHFSKNYRRLQDLQVFDDASRGPLGSFLFLWRMKTKAWLASLACVVMMACLAVDPFAQQIIRYRSHLVPRGNNQDARTWVTQTYDSGLNTSVENLHGVHGSDFMQSAALDAVLGRKLFHPYDCASSNCTWPDLFTLGICSQCVNITGQAMFGCSISIEPSNPGFCSYVSQHPSLLAVRQSYEATNWDYLNNHQTEPYRKRWVKFKSATERKNPSATDTSRIKLDPSLMLSTLDDLVGRSNISRHLFMKDTAETVILKDWKPIAEVTECSLYWCAQQYAEVELQNSTSQQRLARSAPLSVQGVHWEAWKGHHGYYQGGDFNVTFFPPMIALAELAAPDDWPGNKTFYLNTVDMVHIAALMESVFTVELWNHEQIDGGKRSLHEMLQLDYALWKSENLSRTVDSVAESLSDALRKYSNGSHVYGLSFRDETFMYVCWGWFVLPISLVAITTAILIAAIIINDRNKVLLWKSSILPLLFHGLDGMVETPAAQKLSQVNASAMMARARLQVTEENGLRLVLS